MKVLLVEDDLMLREAVQQTLLDHGVDCEAVSTGHFGIGAINRGVFDYVISDYDLGWGQPNGLEVLASVQELPEDKRPVTILWSGLMRDRETDSFEKANGFRPDHVLVKGWTGADKLLTTLGLE